MNMIIEKLTHDQKIRVWLHYIAINKALKYFPPEIKLNKYHEPSKSCKIYPILGVYHQNIYEYKSKTFDEFCNVEDERISEGLKGHFYRFKKEIFNL